MRFAAAALLSFALTGCRTSSSQLSEVRTTVLDIRYATTNNFTKQRLYQDARCFLQPATARKLAAVEEELRPLGLRLKLFDCYRPLSVQRKMWAIVPDERYVANPAQGSRHNRGAAVDLTLVRENGAELPMPTGYDDFSERAHRSYTRLPEEALGNRALLERVMTEHGFVGLPTEWWHFDDVDWQQYPVLDVDVAKLRP
jgi:zinc D-Ala-D-Ala dipeptidase